MSNIQIIGIIIIALYFGVIFLIQKVVRKKKIVRDLFEVVKISLKLTWYIFLVGFMYFVYDNFFIKELNGDEINIDFYKELHSVSIIFGYIFTFMLFNQIIDSFVSSKNKIIEFWNTVFQTINEHSYFTFFAFLLIIIAKDSNSFSVGIITGYLLYLMTEINRRINLKDSDRISVWVLILYNSFLILSIDVILSYLNNTPFVTNDIYKITIVPCILIVLTVKEEIEEK